MSSRLTRIETRLVQLMLYLGADPMHPPQGGIKHVLKDAILELDKEYPDEPAH